VSESILNCFTNNPLMSDVVELKAGISTGDNTVFQRYWHEISLNKCSFLTLTCEETMGNGLKWYPCHSGGEFRKWYGNHSIVINWKENGKEIRCFGQHEGKIRSAVRNETYHFRKGITWSKISSGRFAARWRPVGFMFDDTGRCGFSNSSESIQLSLGLFCSTLSNEFLEVLSPTLSFTSGELAKIPFVNVKSSKAHENINKLVTIAKSDWDSYETSWDFTTLPLLQPEFHHPTLRETYTKLRVHWKEMTLEMQRLEEENNRIFIEAYGLQDELMPDVPLSEITLTCNPHYRYNGGKSEKELEALLLMDTIEEFISYAVGCMFGRYSLDKPGLVLANQGDKIEDYLGQVPEPSFTPDRDNIIPILEDEYFEDDIVGKFKEFLKVTFGEDTLSENLDFIAEALGGNGKKSSEAVIRDYFLKPFYKDHLKMYKKRPIYWLFSSGKGRAFNALIYMHRYNKETLAMMRTDYLLELEGKLDAKREMIKSDIGKDAQEKARLGKMIEELMAYDEVLKNKADEYIEIDLDDGVVVNYGKFEGLVEKI